MAKKLTKAECEALVVDCVKAVLDPKDFALSMQTRFLDSHLGDSLHRVEIIMECEERFVMAVPEEDCDKWLTLGDIAEYAFEHQFTGHVPY